MPTIKRLSFIGLEYAFAPEKAYGMSRGGGFRRQGGLVEVETDAGVRGIGEAFGNPLVTREYFRMVEPLCRAIHPVRPSQAMGDRNTHIMRAQMRDD